MFRKVWIVTFVSALLSLSLVAAASAKFPKLGEPTIGVGHDNVKEQILEALQSEPNGILYEARVSLALDAAEAGAVGEGFRRREVQRARRHLDETLQAVGAFETKEDGRVLRPLADVEFDLILLHVDRGELSLQLAVELIRLRHMVETAPLEDIEAYVRALPTAFSWSPAEQGAVEALEEVFFHSLRWETRDMTAVSIAAPGGTLEFGRDVTRARKARKIWRIVLHDAVGAAVGFLGSGGNAVGAVVGGAVHSALATTL